MVRSVRAAFIVVLILGVAGPGVSTQAELVIQKEGTRLYHRAGCPAIRDGKDVLALTRGEAEKRGLKPHEACDPSKTSTDPSASDEADPESRFVYIDGTKYYHRADCSKLQKKEPTRVELEEAGRKYWPCSTCRPPVRKRNREPAIPK